MCPGRSAARSPCEAVRCRAGAVTNAGVWYGPGSAKRHEECRIASGTRSFISRFPARILPCLRNLHLRIGRHQPDRGKTKETAIIHSEALHNAGRLTRGGGVRPMPYVIAVFRVPDAMRHSSCRFAEPGPRFSEDSWAPALQRTASQELRAALRPGNAGALANPPSFAI